MMRNGLDEIFIYEIRTKDLMRVKEEVNMFLKEIHKKKN